MCGVPELPVTFPRQWLEFADPADPETHFRCDLTWLTSRWTCIFGQGCGGIDEDLPDAGCCTLGAHFSDDDDQTRVLQWAERLTPPVWEQHGRFAMTDIVQEAPDGARQTRVVDGACVFLNRPGFPGGAGCALHAQALAEGVPPVTTKPDVCWQLPIRRTFEDGHDAAGREITITVIGEYTRAGWGPGGHDLHWYCSSNTEAHVASHPVYVTERDALIELMGRDAYEALARTCADLEEARRAGLAIARHPADPA